jgi:COP9 signalosome complex subunit 2
MHKECQLPDGSDDPSKGNQLMDIYALEISMYSARGNNRKLKELYERALKIKGLSSPRIAGIIHECGGKMYMRERSWENAITDFFEAFKNYDDAGARKQSCQCLKYLVLATMLSGSDINPFHEQRAKSYQTNKEIEAMTSLVDAYQRHDLKKFEKELKSNKESIMDDEFIADYIQDLMKKIRSEVLRDLIKPYTNITVGFVARELNISSPDVVELLVEMILDGSISGKIDQINQILLLSGSGKYDYFFCPTSRGSDTVFVFFFPQTHPSYSTLPGVQTHPSTAHCPSGPISCLRSTRPSSADSRKCGPS